MNPHGDLSVDEERLHISRSEHAESVERAQRSDDRRRLSQLVDEKCAQRGSSRVFGAPSIARLGGRGFVRAERCSALREQALRGLPPPEERAGTFGGERFRVEPAHVGSGRLWCIAVRKTIDAASVVACIDAVLLLEMARDSRVILDDFTDIGFWDTYLDLFY